ncbi:MAG: urease accessory protein UreE [Tepidimonas fonticaldi]|nr:urease accessory protein UreE [Tepidimonas fonticaldi]
MLTAARLIPRGQGLAAALLDRSAWISLDWDQRQKSRFDCDDSHGRRVGVFLAPGTVLRGGDVLLTEDGALLRVQAAAQPVLRVTPCPEHGTPLDLLRAAYHLGNRHVPLEVQADHLKLEPDPVLADMLRQMHLIVTEAREPFEPEAGAYAAHSHGHRHGHSHEHSHGHPHDLPPP